MVKTVKYYFVPKHLRVVCTTQRVASVSMIESLAPMSSNDTREISPDRVLAYRKCDMDVLLWVRDPLDRLACAYDVFGKRFATVAEFIEHTLTNENPHWSPQDKLHTFNGVFLPTRVFRFEELAETWAKYLPDYPLIHIGANPNRLQWTDLSKEISRELRIRILDHWKNDFDLRRWAYQYGVHKVAA